MENRKFYDIVNAIRKNACNADELLDTLGTIATLMNELDSGRFHGASYSRTFNVGRLTVAIRFDEYAKNNR